MTTTTMKRVVSGDNDIVTNNELDNVRGALNYFKRTQHTNLYSQPQHLYWKTGFHDVQ